MAVVNAGMTFHSAPQHVRKAFWLKAYPTFLVPGTDLYRFLSPQGWDFGLLDRDATADPFFPGSRTVSDFWIDHETFADIRRWAHESGLSIGEVAHPGLGVKYNWNPTMEEFGWVSLLVPVLGLKGATNRRMFDSGLDGPGITQLWVPNLTSQNVRIVGRAKVEDLIPSFEELGGKARLHTPR